MNRESLQHQIDALPLFEMRDVYVQNPPGTDGTTQQTHRAICEREKTKAWAYVSSDRYRLLQFREIFTPVLQSVGGEVNGALTNYGGSASLTVFPQLEAWQNPENRFGLVARNSVDCSSSILVKFCVQHGPWAVYIPTKVAGLHKAHTGYTATLVKDYTAMVARVQDAWGAIVTKFPLRPVYPAAVPDDQPGVALPDLCERLKLGRRQTLKLTRACQDALDAGRPYTLWDAFVGLLEQVSVTRHKSGWHHEQALDRLCTAVFSHAVLLSL